MHWRVSSHRRPMRNHQGVASGKKPVQAVPALALVRARDSGHALLQVEAGPDVAEEGHAAMLCFIATRRNRKTTPVGGGTNGGFRR